ncbi:hypothetical protein FBF27_01125 [Candidatus Saccharibacteria bacterium oral taxon 488]|nr:hypothetical protein FBF27_01125 [Candidatus Saccharibacteria bacterium oral taxon 488]
MANLNLLSPEIRAAANNAWQRAQEEQKAQSLNTSQGFGSAALLNTLNADVREAREKNKTGFNSLDTIPNPETQRAFEKAFTLSERLVGYIGLSAPTPEQMVSVGVNLQYLAEQFALMEQGEGVAPHVVLAPYSLGKQSWLAIARKMTSDTNIPNNPLQIRKHDHGLHIDLSIKDSAWHSSDQVPTSTTTPALNRLPTHQDKSHPNIKWTLRLLSGRKRPNRTFISYQQSQEQTPPIEHQTLAEGLTDKLTTILAGDKPTDENYYSLCQQPDPDATQILSIHSNVHYGLIYIRWVKTYHRDRGVGIRSPIG